MLLNAFAMTSLPDSTLIAYFGKGCDVDAASCYLPMALH